MSLPMMTSPEDVGSIVNYLKTKATGAAIPEIEAVLGGKLVDGRKLSAYELWGFVIREGDRLKLTAPGRDLARATEERKREIFAEPLERIRLYRLALEWIFHQGFEQVTNVEVAAQWHEHWGDELGTDNENTMRQQAASFFNLSEAAGLGTYLVGRRGQSTRLQVNKAALGQFIGEVALDDSVQESGDSGDVTEAAREDRSAADFPLEEGEGTPTAGVPEAAVRVFIAHSKNMQVVEQIETMLQVADMEYEIAEEEETTAIPVPEKVLEAMRRCSAAVICVTADGRPEATVEKYQVNENVLIEIGTAFVLYDKRVVLVWDRRIPVPSNLQGLYRCEFEGSELSWTTGMKLMKAVAKFRRSDRSPQ